MTIVDLKDNQEYIDEVIRLEHEEWAKDKDNNKEERIKEKISNIKLNLTRNDFCKLLLLNEKELIGFISIFPYDSDNYPNLTPWYATMYVKKEYRNRGYSKLLNDAILEEARRRGFKTLYLKTELVNYYEKFGAKYIENITPTEKLLKFDL